MVSPREPRVWLVASLVLCACPDPANGTDPDGADSDDESTSATSQASEPTTSSATGDPTSDDPTSDDPTSDDTVDAPTTGDATGLPPVCGDGEVDPGELCDDGNELADACLPTCDAEQRVLSVGMGNDHTCALLTDGLVKCWGGNNAGALGLGDNLARGDQPGEMGDALPAVDLGGPVLALRTGLVLTCAQLAGGLKCWGRNGYGQLGLGDDDSRGETPDQMGDALPFVDLGAGATVSTFAVGTESVCAVLTDGRVKCWGFNWAGALGNGSDNDVGDGPGEMGDDLPAVDLGRGVQATAVIAGSQRACALLVGGGVKCWGNNNNGQLGVGDTNNRGDQPGEMGELLPAVDLGAGAVVSALSGGSGHTCALLTDRRVKCWGSNHQGQLGLGDTDNRGDEPGEMGDALPALDLGAGKTPVALGSSVKSTCALFDDGTMKCWGDNFYGQLGLGDVQARGDQPGEMGDALPIVDLGTDRKAAALGQGSMAIWQCVILTDGSLRCFGDNYSGMLGLGHTDPWGYAPEHMGDALPPVRLFSAVW